MPVMPGAEPFFHSGGNTGVLLCHGFTGSPASLRPWADHLAAAGLTVSLPRLPGHGTTWQDMAHTRWEDWYAEVDRAYEELRGHADEIFLMGLSMGGCLALRMAELRGDGVAGLVLVNPSLAADTKLFLLAPVLKLVVPSLKGIGSDIKKEGVSELSYDRVPVRAAATLPQLWKVTQQQLAEVTQPVLVFLSTTDHVVGPASMRVLRAALPAAQLTVRELRRQLPRGHPGQRCRPDLRRQPGVCPRPQPRRPGMRGGARAMTEDASEEAAWRDLVAHYATPAVADGAPAPWPTREDLPGPGPPGPGGGRAGRQRPGHRRPRCHRPGHGRAGKRRA